MPETQGGIERKSRRVQQGVGQKKSIKTPEGIHLRSAQQHESAQKMQYGQQALCRNVPVGQHAHKEWRERGGNGRSTKGDAYLCAVVAHVPKNVGTQSNVPCAPEKILHELQGGEPEV